MIDDEKCENMLKELDEACDKINQKYHPNYYEFVHVLYMMDMKIKSSNIEQFMRECVEEYTKWFENKRKNPTDEELT